jgi:transcriptional regulator with XRE-family HTH domain
MPTRRTKPDPFLAKVGRRIRALRDEKGLTPAELSKKSGVRTSRLLKIERGEIRITIDTVAKLANGLAVEMFDLVTFPEEDDVQRLVDLTRHLSPEQLDALQRKLESLPKRSVRRRRKRDDSPK